MLGHLIRKEILDHFLSLRFLILSAAAALIIWASLYDGYAYYRDCLREYRLGQAATTDRMAQLKTADNRSSAWPEIDALGFRVHKPPTPMSIFVRGLEPSLGRSVRVAGGERWIPTRSPTASEPILGVFPPLDLALVVQVVLSLFVLLFTYDAVCGEKEGGTLRLIASLPVPRYRLLMAKCLGTLLPVLTTFGLTLALGIVAVILMPEVQLNGWAWLRLGIIFGAFGLYLAVFVCLGTAASCLTHRPATSFVLLLTFWVGAVVILPRISLIVADGFQPAPSTHELQAQKEAIRSHYLEERNRLQAQWRQEYLQKNGKECWATPEGREADYLYFSKNRRDSGPLVESEMGRLDETYRNRYHARMALAVVLARFSPAFALHNAVVRVAATGADRHQRFEATIKDLKNQREVWLVRTKDRDVLRQRNPGKYGSSRWDISDFPRFDYRDVQPDEEVSAALIDLGALAAWGLLFYAGACVAVLRYDLR